MPSEITLSDLTVSINDKTQETLADRVASKVEAKLKKDFGIEIDFLNSKIKEIEINNNLIIENSSFKKIFDAVQDGFDLKNKEKIKKGTLKKSKA